MRTPRWLSTLFQALVVLVLALGSAIITYGSVVYFGDDLPPFLLEKLPLPLEDVWMLALRVHVLAAAFALPGCLLLLSTAVLRRWPRFHRWMGRLTGTLVLLALVPSGFYLSLFAKGGVPSTAGFMLSGAIVFVAMVQAIRTARARRFAAHRRFALHVLAQLAVAVVSRAMLVAFGFTEVDEELAYIVSLWVPVVALFALVEVVCARKKPSLVRRRTHEAPACVRVDARRSALDPRSRAARAG